VASSAQHTAIEPERFRHVLGHFPTGVVIATAVDGDGAPAGMAVGSFTSVSLDPPLIAFLPDKSSSSFPRIRSSGSFCINVLAGDQEVVCRAFATRGGDKYGSAKWHASESGSPILEGVVAWIDCDIDQVLEAGDHYIVLGRVRDLDVAAGESPLLFYRGGYGQFSPASLSAPAEPDLLGHLRILDKARPAMEQLASELDVECLAVAAVRDELVTVGSAGRSFGNLAGERIGQRMPFVPPLGCLFLAWADPATVDEWLQRLAGDLADDDARRYRAMVDRVRDRKWSMALASRAQIAFELALANLPARPNEAQAQAVRDAARHVGPDSHEPSDATLSTGVLRVRNISAPVFDELGNVVLMLTLIGLPKSCGSAEFEHYRTRLMQATSAITERASWRSAWERSAGGAVNGGLGDRR
jgi:flavin reductase (DIM6/NTAB) family NADH-FMN oxidoreductase RutF/DNA-binding IclR family transcriptional regulator